MCKEIQTSENKQQCFWCHSYFIASLHELWSDEFSIPCRYAAWDVKVRGAFIWKDDPRIAAMMQQAKLLSSLALRAKEERMEQSLETSWKVRKLHYLVHFLVLTERNGPYSGTAEERESQLNYDKTMTALKLDFLACCYHKEYLVPISWNART